MPFKVDAERNIFYLWSDHPTISTHGNYLLETPLEKECLWLETQIQSMGHRRELPEWGLCVNLEKTSDMSGYASLAVHRLLKEAMHRHLRSVEVVLHPDLDQKCRERIIKDFDPLKLKVFNPKDYHARKDRQ